MPERVLILGGQRSGKSSYAEKLVAASGLRPVYIATGTASDAEMERRISTHRERRGNEWHTVEAHIELSAAILAEAGGARYLLVDSLGTWIGNLMAADLDIEAHTKALIHSIKYVSGPLILVSEEVGLSLVPMNAVARQFVDALGSLNQQIAATAERVIFVAAGLPLVLKAGQNPTKEIS
jgi:adenosylcobinamide kinase/adenosylcobinamide-phosphate guanylyltransferase